jgi:hypothetical protein
MDILKKCDMPIKKVLSLILTVFFLSICTSTYGQKQSIAREWIELTLKAMKEDYTRPPVNARSLFYASIGMYNAWAAYDINAQTYLLGKGDFPFERQSFKIPTNVQQARDEAISYFMYRFLTIRFATSPNAKKAQERFDQFMKSKNYDINYLDDNYQNGSAASLGNYIFWCVHITSLEDGAAENNNFERYYLPKEYKNSRLEVKKGTESTFKLDDPNCWQPIMFHNNAVDQNGNRIMDLQNFECSHWGSIVPFALNDKEKSSFLRDGKEYFTYFNLPAPPQLDSTNALNSNFYQWNYALVSAWSSQLSPFDGKTWDISPASLGNVDINLPNTLEEYKTFYDFYNGWTKRIGYSINPKTKSPYSPQIVSRGDFLRAMAQYWSDGPNSETPPGHWFSILNYVNDQPETIKKWKGEGRVLDDLEWDVKSYLALGGALHDAAIVAWGYKGRYFSIRPISAIKYMVSLGQSSDKSQLNFHPFGIPLHKGLIEVVTEKDPLAGHLAENIGKIKIFSWKGHTNDSLAISSGSNWILGEDWMPFLKLNFITPPFPGYISGHSCFSQAAAEVLTEITGDAYFPRGLGEYKIPKNTFFFNGERLNSDIILQWATYYDAADQCGLSRIYSGIHPPCDDIPARNAGRKIGKNVIQKVNVLFNPTNN